MKRFKNIFLGLLSLLMPTLAMAGVPTWSVNPEDFQNSTTVTSKLNVHCVELKNANNMLGAFVGGQCRGVTKSDVVSGANYFAFLTVFANMEGETVTFKIYDAAKDSVYDAKNTIVFSSVTPYGTPSNPYMIYQNNPPSGINLSANTVDENAASGTAIGNLSTVDTDGGTFSYVLVSGTGSTDNSLFSITSNSLKTASVLNYENKSAYSILVQAYEADGCSVNKIVTINANDLNEAPTGLSMTNTAVNENETSGTVIGSASTIDPDAGSTFAYSIFNLGNNYTTGNALVSITNDGILKTTSSLNFESILPNHNFKINVRVTDNGGLTFDKEFTITVNDKNDAPTNIALTNTNITENKASGTSIGLLSGTDPDAGDSFILDFSAIGQSDNNKFVIVDNELRTNEIFDYETKSIYYVNIKATDLAGAVYSKQFAITVVDTNDVPTNVALSNATIGENAPTNSLIGRFTTTDQDGTDNFTYALVAGTGDEGNANFNLKGDSLRTTGTFNAATKSTYSIRLRVTDKGNKTFEKAFTITITEDNEAPTNISISNAIITETKAIGTTVGVLTVTDPDGVFPNGTDTHTLDFVSGQNNSNSSFTLVGNELRTNEVFDFEAKNLYYVYVKATDQIGASFTKQLIITVKDTNEVPTDLAISANSFSEDLPTNSFVAKLSSTDQDANSTFTYTLVSGSGSTGNAAFKISNDSLFTNQTFRASVQSNYSIRLQTRDNGTGNLTFAKIFNLTVLVDNDTPTNITISKDSVQENLALGAVVGNFTTVDQDLFDTYQYTFVSEAGNNNDQFQIVNNQLITNATFDFETKKLYYIYVKTTDQLGASFTKQFIVKIFNGNDAPTNIALTNTVFSEKAAIGSFIGKFSSTDQDATDSYAYSLVAGSGAEGNNAFLISHDSIFTNQTFKFSTQSSYTIRVRSTDAGTLNFDKNFTMTVTLQNTTPSDLALTKTTVAENSAIGTVVGTLSTTDADAGDTHSYQLFNEAGNNNDQFIIVDNQLKTNAQFDYETKKLYYVYIKSTDQIGASKVKQFIINITPANDAPTNISLTNNTFSEKVAKGTLVGRLTSTDQDSVDTYTYSLVSGIGADGNAAFLIKGDSIVTNVLFKYSTQNSYSIRLQSKDAGNLTFVKNFTMIVTQDNAAPSDISLSKSSIVENAATGSLVGNLSTTDSDQEEGHIYTLADESGNNNNMFVISNVNELHTNATFDYETKKIYYVYVKSTDAVGASKTKQFIITVTPGNDAPTNILLSNSVFSEKSPKGSFIGRFSSIDQDSVDTYSYSLIGGTGDAGNKAFRIKGDSILTDTTFNFATQSTYSIRVSSKDAGNLSTEKVFTMTVTLDNSAPTEINLSKTSVAENSAINTLVGTLSTIDPDGAGDSHTYTLSEESGNNNNLFIITANSELRTKEVFDYETKKLYFVYIKSADQHGAAKVKQFAITITPANDAPTNIALTNNAFSEKSPLKTFIGKFSSTDQDSVDTYKYTFVAGSGEEGNTAFQISNDSIFTNKVFKYATQSQYSVRIRSTDFAGLYTEKVFSMIVNLDNTAPKDIAISNATVAENMPVGALVGKFTTTDIDTGDVFTYTLANEPGNNNDQFIITNTNELHTTASFDYETKKIYYVFVNSADQVGASKTKQFTITVTPGNDAPTGIALSNNTFSEKVPVRSFIGKFNSTDQDSTDTYAYSFVAGTGDAGNKKFYISRDSIFTDTIFKFATQSLFTVRVRSTDLGGLSFEKVFNMNVTLDNTPPNDIMLNTNTVAENSAVGALVGSFTTNDIDPGDIHKYELVDEAGNNNAQFVIVNTNELHTTASFDYETKKIYYVYVKSTDQVGASKTKQFIINISDANDAPTNMNLSNNTFSEKSPLKTFIGTFSSTDQDMVDSYSYKLTPGAGESGNSSFTISGDSIFTNKYFKYITQSTYSIRVKVTDAGNASFEKNFTMNVTLDNTAPKDIAISSPKVAENLAAGAVVGTFSTTDVDTADTHSYQFAPQTPNSNDLFVIVGNELRTDTNFDYEAKKLYYIYVKSTDNIGASTIKQFIIEITDANDAPTNVALSNNSFSEESPIKTFIGKLSSTDQDAVDTYNYTLVAGNGAEGNDAFSISGDSIFTRIKFKASVQNKYSIRVRSTDLAGGSFTKNFQMNVLLDNKIPSDITFSSNSVAENKPEGTTVGTFATVDADLDDTHLYSFHEGSANDNGQFTLVEGALKTNKSFDFETKKIYYVYIKTTDNEGASFVKQFAINITDANDAPTAMAITNNNFGEDKPVHTFIGKFMTTDVDAGDGFNYTFTPGVGDVGNSAFSIGHDSLFTNQLFDRNSQASYSIRVKSTDMGGQFISQNFTILVNEANSNPTNITLSQSMINENNTIGDAIGTFSTADPDANDKFTYTLTSAADNAAFEISPSGVLKAREKFDFETKSSYAISVRSTDDGGLFTEKNFTISIVDKNDAPTETALSNNTVGENMAIGTVVGLLSSTDQDAGDAHTYKLSTNAQTDNAMFFISGKSLMTKEIFDFEKRAVYGVEVIATDKSGATFTQQFEINVLDKGDAPTDMVLSTTLFLEDSPVNTMISEFVTTDVDAEDVFLYAFVAGPQTADNAAFRIENNALYTNKTYDINVQENYTIKVKVTDKYGLSFEKLLTLTVKNSNNAPENIAISKNKVEENKEAGTVVGNFSTTDADTGDTHKYTLVTGEGSDDNDKFVIVGNNLVTDETLNFENKSSLSVRVKSTDFAGATFEKTFTISVLDRNDAPTDIITSTTNFNENQAIGSTVLLFGTTDEDNGDQFTYTFDVAQTNDNDKFLIDGNKLLTFANFNYEQKSIYIVRVTSKDLAGVSFTKQMVLKVNDVNDIPTELKLSNNSFPENETSKVFFGKLSTKDEDAGDVHTYTLPINPNYENQFFTISGDSIFANVNADYEKKKSYSILVKSTDKGDASIENTFTIAVTDNNDKPSLISLSNNVVSENSEANTVIGLLTATDQDASESFIFTLGAESGMDNGNFSIDGNKLVMKQGGDFETKDAYIIAVTATDMGGDKTSKSFLINLTNVNEAPAMTSEIFTIEENTVYGAFVGQLRAADVDANDNLSYAMVDTAGLPFAINNEGDLVVAGEVDYEKKSEFEIAIRVTDNGGLSSVATVFVKLTDAIEGSTELPINKVLSPNGDGVNDFFAIDNVELYDDYTLTVFTDAGTVVYTVKGGYKNNWDATFNGKHLDSGTYYYLMQSNTDEKQFFKGFFTIIND